MRSPKLALALLALLALPAIAEDTPFRPDTPSTGKNETLLVDRVEAAEERLRRLEADAWPGIPPAGEPEQALLDAPATAFAASQATAKPWPPPLRRGQHSSTVVAGPCKGQTFPLNSGFDPWSQTGWPHSAAWPHEPLQRAEFIRIFELRYGPAKCVYGGTTAGNVDLNPHGRASRPLVESYTGTVPTPVQLNDVQFSATVVGELKRLAAVTSPPPPPPPPRCGDGDCSLAERFLGSCPEDCAPPPDPCGDGVCDPLIGETHDSCAADCPPPPPPPPPAVCGDSVCDLMEPCSCPECASREDCRVEPPTEPTREELIERLLERIREVMDEEVPR